MAVAEAGEMAAEVVAEDEVVLVVAVAVGRSSDLATRTAELIRAVGSTAAFMVHPVRSVC